jgi:FKBP-type peptidyl-prolyl cis-trans isomerase FkpA
MKKHLALSALLLVAFTFGCAKHKAKKQEEKEETTIQSYISDYGLNAVPTGSGLYYVIESQGTGSSCTSQSDVVVAYTGYFTNNEVFDQSSPAGVQFNLQNVIEGWTEGIPYFKEGGTGKLLIPSHLAYGATGSPNIPPNTVLIFDVEMIDVI